PHAPLILRKQAVAIVVRSLILAIVLWLPAIADAEQHLIDRELLQVCDSRQQSWHKRPGPRGVKLQAIRQYGIDRTIDARDSLRECGQVQRVPKHDERRFDVFPTAAPVKMLPLTTEAHAMLALLPAHGVSHLIGAQLAVLRRVQVVADDETA